MLSILKKEEELELVVTGRKTGREIPRPVWFVVRGDDLLLLPVKGSLTHWYKNILKNPRVKISVKGQSHDGQAQSVTEQKKVSEVVELFRKKYGAEDIRKYYPKLDVAARLPLA